MNMGDICSEIAYKAAKQTFKSRAKAKIGRPLKMEGGFTGAIDYGDFYLVQNDDGVGTKMMIAEAINKFDTVGIDLAAMVADDAVCVGAEVVTISNTIDAEKPDKKTVSEMMKGLSKACREQKIIIPGGEIAELKDMVKGYVWNATATGIVEKKKIITGDKIKPGDTIIGLYSPNLRSNGFTLVRYILEKALGRNCYKKKFGKKTWGETVLQPSVIYHNAVLSIYGRFKEKPKINLKGIAHITGNGLPGNTPRVFGRKKYGILLNNLFETPKMMLELQKLGSVSDRDAYETWNMGVGMILVVAKRDTKKTLNLLAKQKIRAQIVGKIIKDQSVTIINKGCFERGKALKFGL